MAYSLKIAAVAAAILLAGPAASQATTLTYSLSELGSISDLGGSGGLLGSFYTGTNGTSVGVTTIFAASATGSHYAYVGLLDPTIPFGSGDELALQLTNTNENPWTFQLVADTDQGIKVSPAVSLAPGSGSLFMAPLGGTAGLISSAYFIVSAIIPISGYDRTAEYRIAPAAVPLPPALALFAGPLIGLGLWSRRRAKAAQAV